MVSWLADMRGAGWLLIGISWYSSDVLQLTFTNVMRDLGALHVLI